MSTVTSILAGLSLPVVIAITIIVMFIMYRGKSK